MYLLYCDESGSSHDPKWKFFVLAGFATFERQAFWFSEELDKIAARFDPSDPNAVELHGNPMYRGKGVWRRFSREDRVQAMKDALRVLASSHPSNRLFGSIINRDSAIGTDVIALSFEQIASRFDYYLQRIYRRNNAERHRGIIIFDKTSYEGTIQRMATDFRSVGHSWGVIRNLAEVPLFLDSKASRLIQLADLVAYATFRYYQHGDDQFYSIIRSRFDTDGGIVHGIHEIL